MSDFENAVAAERRHLDDVARVEEQQAEEAERKRLLADLALRDGIWRRERHLGTPLQEVFDDTEVRLCQEFLHLMADNDYPGASLLREEEMRTHPPAPKKKLIKPVMMPWQALKITYWNMYGYPIGICGDVVRREDADRMSWPTAVYLCVDETIRLGGLQKDPQDPVESPTDLREYKNVETSPITTGFAKTTLAHTKRMITRFSVANNGSTVPVSTESVDMRATFWYEFSPLSLENVLVKTAARHLE